MPTAFYNNKTSAMRRERLSGAVACEHRHGQPSESARLLEKTENGEQVAYEFTLIGG